MSNDQVKEKYLKKGVEIRDALMKVITDDWTFDKEQDGIKLFTKTMENSNCYAFRGICEVDVPADEYYKLVKGLENIKEFDKNLGVCNLLNFLNLDHYVTKFDDENYISYIQYNVNVPFISNRDCLILESCEQLKSGTFVSKNLS